MKMRDILRSCSESCLGMQIQSVQRGATYATSHAQNGPQKVLTVKIPKQPIASEEAYDSATVSRNTVI